MTSEEVYFFHQTPTELAKEIFWLAWQACGSPSGMGFLQNNPGATRDKVWNNIINAGDYDGPPHFEPNKPYADYVFGRMMKFDITINKDSIEIVDKELRPDYQSWCRKYNTINDLVNAALNNLSFKNN
jgi:hypothetical protein